MPLVPLSTMAAVPLVHMMPPVLAKLPFIGDVIEEQVLAGCPPSLTQSPDELRPSAPAPSPYPYQAPWIPVVPVALRSTHPVGSGVSGVPGGPASAPLSVLPPGVELEQPAA